jgi:hypothetical protein
MVSFFIQLNLGGYRRFLQRSNDELNYAKTLKYKREKGQTKIKPKQFWGVKKKIKVFFFKIQFTNQKKFFLYTREKKIPKNFPFPQKKYSISSEKKKNKNPQKNIFFLIKRKMN